jgi:hypothetical protein
MDWQEFDMFSASDVLGYTPPLAVHRGPGPGSPDYDSLFNHPLGIYEPETVKSSRWKPPVSDHAASKNRRKRRPGKPKTIRTTKALGPARRIITDEEALEILKQRLTKFNMTATLELLNLRMTLATALEGHRCIDWLQHVDLGGNYEIKEKTI